MARYLISFDRGWMRFSEEDLPDVAEAAHAVVQEAQDAGVFVFGGGIADEERTTLVGVDVPTRADAIAWAAKVAAACRCSQEVREFLPDPTVDDWLAR